MLTSEQLPNLMNGVSQQTPSLRLTSQAERQINGFSSVVEGVNKRQPTLHVAKVFDGQLGDVKVHTINRDTTERYQVIVSKGAVRVFDMVGGARNVAMPNGAGYIDTDTPSKDLRLITIADTTFVINTKKRVAISQERSVAPPSECLIFIRSIAYDTTYNVAINGSVVGTYTTPSAYADKPVLSMAYLVDGLANDLRSRLGAGWGVDNYGPVIRIVNHSNHGFTVRGSDTGGNQNIRTIHGKTQAFTDLPVMARHGMVIRIAGETGASNHDYWLRFESNIGEASGQGLTEGAWRETVEPNTQIGLDPTTMPHALVRQADGSFSLGQIDWGRREVGSEESSPWPSFVGYPIRDIYFDHNRLCFLSDSNVVMSRTGSLFSFFRETALTLLDTDPIDIAASGSKVSLLQYAVPFNKMQVFFSDQTQFVIDASEMLASAPPTLREVTAYEFDNAAKPVAVGRTVYFSVKRGAYSGLMEYYLMADSDATDATDVTKHVPTYIPEGLFKISASTTSDVVLALTEKHRSRIYVYKYFWNGDQKLQSSWSHWQFASDVSVLSVEFIGDKIVLMLQYPDGVYFETMDITEGITDEGQLFVTRLDRRITEAGVEVTYDGYLNRSTFSLPYTPHPETLAVVTRPNADGTNAGITAHKSVDVVGVAGKTVTCIGDLRGKRFFVGQKYEFLYEFSEPVLKTQASTGGTAALAAGRLQINRWLILYANTGYFKAVVSNLNGQSYSYVFSGKTLGTASSVLGNLKMTSGVFPFRVNRRATDLRVTITSDSFLPVSLTGAEWEGRYERRSSRV